MDTIEVPPDVYPRVHAVEERVQVFRERGDWGGALAAWLELARAYPHDTWPVRILAGEYRSASEHLRALWVDLGMRSDRPLQLHQTPDWTEGTAGAEREFLSVLQHRLVTQLEALTAHRGIRIYRPRRVRSGFYVGRYLIWVPWGGHALDALYVHTVRPTRLFSPSTGRGPHAVRMGVPGYNVAFVIAGQGTRWYPWALAHMLAHHLVIVRQCHRWQRVVEPVAAVALRQPGLRARWTAVRQARQRIHELIQPLDAAESPEGQAAVERLEEAILVHLIRRELRLTQKP